MRIGLIDVDSHNFPNLAQMKLSAWHKENGDIVERHFPYGKKYDKVYMSKVFDDTYTKDYTGIINGDDVIKGGTGYGINDELPYEIEHIMPDYSIYGIQDEAYGFLTRGCPRGCQFCIVSSKEGNKSVKAADLTEFWIGQPNIILLDPNIFACKDWKELIDQLADSKANVRFCQGLDLRFMNEETVTYLNKVKSKRYYFAWDLMSEEESVTRGMEAMNKYSKKKNRWDRIVYVLTNFNTCIEEDLYRINKLLQYDFHPYIMIYDKPNAPKEILNLAAWVNNRHIFEKVSWEDFKEWKNK